MRTHGRHSKGVGFGFGDGRFAMRAMVYCGFGSSSLHACHTTNRLSTPFVMVCYFAICLASCFVENKMKFKRFSPYCRTHAWASSYRLKCQQASATAHTSDNAVLPIQFKNKNGVNPHSKMRSRNDRKSICDLATTYETSVIWTSTRLDTMEA